MDTLRNVCDSVASCVKSFYDGCQPIVKVAETNCADVEIVRIICETVNTFILAMAVLFFIQQLINAVIKFASKKQVVDDIKKRDKEIAELKEQINKIKQTESSVHERAINLLNNIVDKVTIKDGGLDIEKVNRLLNIYNDIKNDFANEENNNEN